jgi:hypothetical protein
MDIRDFPLRPVVVDTEFRPQPDGTQEPVAVVARDMWSGEVRRRMVSDLGRRPFFPSGSDTCLVAHNAAAELETYRALGWPWPRNIFDTYSEHLRATNGLPQHLLHGVLPRDRASLLAALRCWGLPTRPVAEKRSTIALILRGGPYSPAEVREILDYCEEDVSDTAGLFLRLLSHLELWELEGALLRGQYAWALADFSRNGMFVDAELHDAVIANWDGIRAATIESVADYGVYMNGKFSFERFERLLERAGAESLWPTTASGQRSTAEKVLREMADYFPLLARFCHAQISLGQMAKVRPLAIGPDSRVRLGKRELAYQRLGMPVPDDDQRSIGWGAYRSKTGRNQPQAKDFVLLRNAWWRTMITPPPGKALLYCDWSSQEIAIAAYSSGDPIMIEHYQSGDFYLHFAKSPTAQLVPPWATKATHGEYRNLKLKPTCLGTIYGMREHTLALRLGCSLAEAQRLLRAHRDTYRAFWTWVEDRVSAMSLVGRIDTPLGWSMHIGDIGRSEDGPWTTSERTLLNWSMQSCGGDLLRLACIALSEAGVRLSFPLHDAIAVECDLVEVEEVSRLVSVLMERAAEVVLGAPVPVEIDVIRPGENLRHGDKADAMWRVVQSALPQRDWAGEKLCQSR